MWSETQDVLEETEPSALHPIMLYDNHYIRNAFQGCSRQDEPLRADAVLYVVKGFNTGPEWHFCCDNSVEQKGHCDGQYKESKQESSTSTVSNFRKCPNLLVVIKKEFYLFSIKWFSRTLFKRSF